MTRDPFSVLGVSSSATEDEIKSAYRKLAKKYHPDLNPGDRAAEEKMKEVNEAYAQAMQFKKNGGKWNPGEGPQQGAGYGPGAGGWQGYQRYGGSPFGGFGSSDRGGSSGDFYYGFRPDQRQSNPFGGFGFDPFADMFGGRRTEYRTRSYSNPELETVQNHVLARRFQDALELLSRISTHDADWHALFARANLGLGNRISALEHARKANQMAPGDPDYQMLLQEVESGRQSYQQSRRNGYDFRTTVCSNPFLSCCAANLLCNCCLGGRYGFCC